MRNKAPRSLYTGIMMTALFVFWTVLLRSVDVQPAGESGTAVGFATVNSFFHRLTGVHMWIYTVTDWLGLVPVFVCLGFGVLGLAQLVKRKSLLKVDGDILLLGGYYVVVMCCYLIFEKIPFNYRPILIEGRMEVSYPSSTTLLVLCVMPTLVFQLRRRVERATIQNGVTVAVMVFSVAMVFGRLVSGVHWLTDIIGGVLLSAGLFELYRGIVLCREEKRE